MAAIKKKNPGGRPTKYKEEYCDMLLKHMEKGFPFETFASKVKVSLRTLYEWVEVHAKFSQAKKTGETALYQHYVEIGLGLSTGKINGNVTAWIFMMKNLCAWRDVHQNNLNVSMKTVTPKNVGEIYEAAHMYEKHKRVKGAD